MAGGTALAADADGALVLAGSLGLVSQDKRTGWGWNGRPPSSIGPDETVREVKARVSVTGMLNVKGTDIQCSPLPLVSLGLGCNMGATDLLAPWGMKKLVPGFEQRTPPLQQSACAHEGPRMHASPPPLPNKLPQQILKKRHSTLTRVA